MRRLTRAAVGAALLLLLAALPAAAAEILVGSGTFEIPAETGIGPGRVRVYYFRPPRFGRDSPIVMVMHGPYRNAEDYRDYWKPAAEQDGALILVPEFDARQFPDLKVYTLCKGPARAVVEATFMKAVNDTGSRETGYRLFGHSAGAQFVHRFLMLAPSARIERAVAANAGYYTFPDLDTDFPYGLHGTDIDEEDLKRAFARPLTIMLGAADTDPTHPLLRRTPEALAQGPHRYARGKSFMASAMTEAQQIGAKLAWNMVAVPAIALDGQAMSRAAAPLVLDIPEPSADAADAPDAQNAPDAPDTPDDQADQPPANDRR